MKEGLHNAPVGVIKTARDGEVTAANPAIGDLLETDHDELTGQDVGEVLPRAATGAFREAFCDGPPPGRTIEEYCPALKRWLAVETGETSDGMIVYVRDTSERHEQSQRINRLEQRLSRLRRIDSLIDTVLGQIIDVSDPEEVWHTVCQGLGTADLYEFVWIGDRDITREQLRVAASAGDAAELREALDGGVEPDCAVPERRAVEHGTTQTADSIAENEGVPRNIRVAAFGRGLQSSLGIPVTYGDTIYGVIGVYTAREDGFNQQEITSLETLGTIAGFAVNAIRQEDLLFADTITELKLAIEDDNHPFIKSATVANVSLSLAGAIPQDDEGVVCYLRSSGTDDDVVAALDGHEAVSAVRVVEGGDTEPLFEATVSGATPITTVTDWGAAVTDAVYTSDNAELIVELRSEDSVRDIVEAIGDQFGRTSVRATKRKPREPETVDAFIDQLSARLTDKQRRVLRTAYLSEYFTSPRGSTSAQVAEALDITGPTVLYHLRSAQRKLLDAFFTDSAMIGEDQQPRS
jgi:predicted DNA binding protein